MTPSRHWCGTPSTRIPLRMALRSDLMSCRGTRCGGDASLALGPCPDGPTGPCAHGVEHDTRPRRAVPLAMYAAMIMGGVAGPRRVYR